MTLVSTANSPPLSRPTSGRPGKRPDCSAAFDFADDFDDLDHVQPADGTNSDEWSELDSGGDFDPEPTDDELLGDFDFDCDYEEVGPPPEDLWNEADWE